jgi:Pyridoxamine 5'-phosphate oxidase
MREPLGVVQDQTFARASAATLGSYPPEQRLSDGQLAAYLDRRVFAVVGSARADGRPHAAMSSYLRRGATFWLSKVAGSVRERNVRGTPWLTMVVAEGERGDHIVVIIEGPAEMVPPDKVPGDVRAVATGDWISAWIRVTAERVLSYASEGTA